MAVGAVAGAAALVMGHVWFALLFLMAVLSMLGNELDSFTALHLAREHLRRKAD